jgi:hypothetical protein
VKTCTKPLDFEPDPFNNQERPDKFNQLFKKDDEKILSKMKF